MQESIEVRPLGVSAAGRHVAATAAALERVRPEHALTAAAVACPGSLLAAAGLAGATSWGQRLAVATADLYRTADLLAGGAQRYTRADERASGRTSVSG